MNEWNGLYGASWSFNRLSPVPRALWKPHAPASPSCITNQPKSALSMPSASMWCKENYTPQTHWQIAASGSTVCLAWNIKWDDSHSYDHTLPPPKTSKWQVLNLILSFRASYSEIHFQVVVTQQKKKICFIITWSITFCQPRFSAYSPNVGSAGKRKRCWAPSGAPPSLRAIALTFESLNHQWWQSPSRSSITI